MHQMQRLGYRLYPRQTAQNQRQQEIISLIPRCLRFVEFRRNELAALEYSSEEVKRTNWRDDSRNTWLAIFANYVTMSWNVPLEQRSAAMPTRNVNLTHELDRFVLSKVECGRYENASEVVRAALRTMEREEQEYAAKLDGLRGAIDEGDASGTAESDPFARVREALNLSA